jgi:type IV secretion system protein VirB5
MKRLQLSALSLGLLLAASQVKAQLAVVDLPAIVQMVLQLRMLEQQLDQAKSEFTAITGGRGMERLLSGTVRNYLPASWQELSDTLGEAQSLYGALASEVQSLRAANAILSPEQMALLPASQRREIDAARQSAAMLQGLTRQALASTSERFSAIQELIDAIGHADDQKAILDLQARIGAEHDMLANENTKLQVIFQSAQAEEWARRQREKEQALLGIGSLRELPPMGLAATP